MTDKFNLTFTERQIDLLKVGLGLALADLVVRNRKGEVVELHDQDVTIEEVLDVGSILVDKLGEPTVAAEPDALSEADKFLLAGCIGSMLRDLGEKDTPESRHTSQRVQEIGLRLGLLSDPARGLVSFLKEFGK